MKPSTKYALAGCAGVAAVVGGLYGAYRNDQEFIEQKTVVAQELNKVGAERKDLDAKLRNCSSVEECRTAYSLFQTAEEKYTAVKNKHSELAKADSVFSTSSGLFGLISAVGFAAAAFGFAKAYDERCSEKWSDYKAEYIKGRNEAYKQYLSTTHQGDK